LLDKAFDDLVGVEEFDLGTEGLGERVVRDQAALADTCEKGGRSVCCGHWIMPPGTGTEYARRFRPRVGNRLPLRSGLPSPATRGPRGRTPGQGSWMLNCSSFLEEGKKMSVSASARQSPS